MTNHFNVQNLQSRCFKGQDLTGFDFSHSDIRGSDFTNAILTNANFSGARAGQSNCWFIGSLMISLGLAGFAGLIAGWGGGIVGYLMMSTDDLSQTADFSKLPVMAATALPILLSTFIYVVLKKGLGLGLGGYVLIVSSTFIFVAAVVPNELGNHVVGVIFILLFIVSFIAATGIHGTATALACFLDKKLIFPLSIFTALACVTFGALEGSQTSHLSHNSSKVIALLIAGFLSVCMVGLSAYIGRKAFLEDKRYFVIHKLAIYFASFGGTSFRAANCTDTDFSKASLRSSDLRKAILARTNFSETKGLSQALVSETYLVDSRIRLLVTSKVNLNQDFEYKDLREVNLENADLSGSSFKGADLSEANLRNSNLCGSNLAQTQLYRADLTGACFTGAYIQDWGISTDTNFEAVRCDYVYMQLPTKADPDPCRKPDNRSEMFQPGDFADFIAPIIKTLNLYQTQHVDLRMVAQQFKTLDLFHHEGIDPTAAAIALKQLAQQHPEAELEVVALEGRGDDKVRVQAKVTGIADRSALSAEYFTKYEEISALPFADLQSLLAGIAEKDERIRSLEGMVMTAIESNKFYVETYYNLGDTVSEKGAINISSGGGSVSGIVGGDIKDVSGVVNLGAISGDVSNAIGQLPDASNPDEPSLKDLLTQLKTAIEAEAELSPEDKAEALEQVKTLAEAGQAPEDGALKKAAKTAMKVLKGTVSGLSEVNKLAQECTKLLPIITTLLVLV